MPVSAKSQERALQIGERLRAAREGLLVSQTRFAVRVGIGRERLASYESGRVSLPWAIAFQIYSTFGINPLWLATGDGEKIGPLRGGVDERVITVSYGSRPLLAEVADEILAPLSQNRDFSPNVRKAIAREWPSRGPTLLDVQQSSAWNRIAFGPLREVFAAVPHDSTASLEAELTELLANIRHRFSSAKAPRLKRS